MTRIEAWPAGNWLLRVTSTTDLITSEPITLHLPNVGDSDQRGDVLAELVTSYLHGATGLRLGAGVWPDRTGLAIINEGEHRFTTLDFDIRPDEEGDQ